MKIKYLSLFLLLFSFAVFSQEDEGGTVKTSVDSLYREDQFYANLTYNLVQGKPAGYSQRGFSTGIAMGFLRDMPLNKERNFSIAAGLGYSFNSLKHNLVISETALGNSYATVETGSFDKNKLELHYIDLPLEMRWRTSGPVSHKFWRIYTGVKLSYLLGSKSVYQNSAEKYKISGVQDLNKLQSGVYITAGYNTWNLYAYYGLSPIFKSGKIANEDLKLNSLNLGIMFYIL